MSTARIGSQLVARVSVFALCLLVGIFTLVFSTPAHAASGQAQFTMSTLNPATGQITARSMRVQSNNGSSLQEMIKIENSGTAAGVASLSAVDATTTMTGDLTYQSQTAKRRDVGAWITLSSQQISLQAGESRTLAFQLAVPQQAYAGYHLGGIALENLGQQTSSSRVIGTSTFQVIVMTRQVLPVQVILPGASINRLIATGLQLGGTDKQQIVNIGLQNTGSTLLSLKGAFEIQDSHGQVIQRNSLTLKTLLPKDSVGYPLAIVNKVLLPGSYTTQLDLAYGHNQSLHTQQTLTVTSAQVQKIFHQQGLQAPDLGLSTLAPWQLVGIGLILLLIVGTGSFWVYKGVRLVRRIRASNLNRKSVNL